MLLSILLRFPLVLIPIFFPLLILILLIILLIILLFVPLSTLLFPIRSSVFVSLLLRSLILLSSLMQLTDSALRNSLLYISLFIQLSILLSNGIPYSDLNFTLQ
jgi:hypothetical protein